MRTPRSFASSARRKVSTSGISGMATSYAKVAQSALTWGPARNRRWVHCHRHGLPEVAVRPVSCPTSNTADVPRASICGGPLFLLAALYLLGPRVSELASHTMGSLYRRNGCWWWRVVGKGEREAKVPANDDLVAALKRYRKFLGLTPTPAPADPTPMILNITGTRGISTNMIYRLIKKFFAHVAVEAEHRLPDSVDLFNRVSTHWLRHTSITHQADAGIALRYLSRNARHARLETTGIYLHAEDKKWHAAMNKLHLRVKLGASDRREVRTSGNRKPRSERN